MKYEMFLVPSVSLKQSAVQTVSFLPPTICLQVCVRKQNKIHHHCKAKKKKNPEKSKTTEKKSQKTPILKAQSITLKAQCMWLPCYKSLSTLHFNSSFTASPLCATCFLKAQMQFFTFLGLTLQVKELNYTSSYRPEAIYLKKFAHLRSSIE